METKNIQWETDLRLDDFRRPSWAASRAPVAIGAPPQNIGDIMPLSVLWPPPVILQTLSNTVKSKLQYFFLAHYK